MKYTLTLHIDHAVHNRPGVVERDATSPTGVRWTPATWRQEGERKVVYRLVKSGKTTERTRLGVLHADDTTVKDGERVVGELRAPGLVPEVVTWLYQQMARVWQLDKRNVTLPSGQRLSREGFRDVQRWLVKRDLATSQPYYQLTVTPEAVATELEKE